MAKKPLAKQFGTLIKQLRREAGYSQEEFGAECGLHRTYIGMIERGEKTVTIETAAKLAHALKMKVSEIFVMLEQNS